jgi:hypothetical protein
VIRKRPTIQRFSPGIVLALTGTLLMTGCTPAPTGDALYADAEQTYFSYREVVNELQLEYDDGPWEVGSLGSYGMQPNQCETPQATVTRSL